MTKKNAITISFANQKGGTGKSTLLFCLGYAFSQTLKTTIGFLDGDSQGTLTNFYRKSDVQENIKLYVPKDFSEQSIIETIQRAKSEVDLLFIDTPGKFDKSLLPFLTEANLILAPFKVTSADLATTMSFAGGFMDEIKKRFNLNAKVALIPNQVITSSNQKKMLQDSKMIEQLKNNYGIYVFENIIANRVGFTTVPMTIAAIMNQQDFLLFVKEFVALLKTL